MVSLFLLSGVFVLFSFLFLCLGSFVRTRIYGGGWLLACLIVFTTARCWRAHVFPYVICGRLSISDAYVPPVGESTCFPTYDEFSLLLLTYDECSLLRFLVYLLFFFFSNLYDILVPLVARSIVGFRGKSCANVSVWTW